MIIREYDKLRLNKNSGEYHSVEVEKDSQIASLKRKIIIVLISSLVVILLLPVSIKFKMIYVILVLLIIWFLIPNSDKSEVRARFLLRNPGLEPYP